MNTNRNYLRCHINGEGEFTDRQTRRGMEFRILDISASGIRIQTSADLEEDKITGMKIRLSGHIFDIVINVNGIVTRKIKNE